MFADDIRAARELGLDGFALNRFSRDQANPDMENFIIEQQNQGIPSTEFGFFLSMDGDWPLTDTLGFVQDWGADPYYIKVDGKPLLGTYSGESFGDTAWTNQVTNVLETSGLGVTFIPYFERTDPNGITPTQAAFTTVLNTFPNSTDGLHQFFSHRSVPYRTSDPNFGVNAAWSSLDLLEAESAACKAKSKKFMGFVAPYYWAVDHSARQYYEYMGGRGLEAQFTSIMGVAQQPHMLEIATWNDYTESTYISPSRIVPGIPGFASPPHLGYYELLKYFIKWYKTGVRPAIVKDAFFFFHRMQRKNAVASNDAGFSTITFNQNQVQGNCIDALFITTALTAPAELRITTGGVLTTIQVGMGLVHTDHLFNTGAQHIELWRNSVKLAEMDGATIVANPTTYNFHVHSGYAIVGGSTSNTWLPRDTVPAADIWVV